MRVFVDTNVLLDVIANRPAFYEDSALVWTLAERGQIEALVAASSFTDVYYIVRRLANRRKAKTAIRLLLEVFRVADCGERVLVQAVDARFKDFEDAVQYFAAIEAGAEVLITRNPKDFPDESICPVMTPSEFLAAYSFLD